jgi:N-acetylneuraminic acid mutarotase
MKTPIMKYIVYSIVLFSSLLLSGTLSAQQLPRLPIPLGAATVQTWRDTIFSIGGSSSWGGSIVYPRIYRYTGGPAWAYHDSIPDNNVWGASTVLVGDDLYLLSGWSGGAALARRYNIRSRAWQSLPNSPNSFSYGSTAQHVGGSIYLVNPNGANFRYRIADSTWITVAPAGTTGASALTSVMFQNEMYVVGLTNRGFRKYTPATNTWTTLADVPYASVTSGLSGAGLGVVNGEMYAAGGANGSSSGAGFDSVLVYNFAANQWRRAAQRLSSPRHWVAVAPYRGGLYAIGGFNVNGAAVDTVEQIVPQGTSSVSTSSNLKPSAFALEQNYPNPFNPSTEIRYQVSGTSDVRLDVFDLLGRKVSTLVNERQAIGAYRVNFNAANLSSGTYFYRLQAGGFVETKKMMLIK